jgi:hypothetical protein
MIPAHLTPSRSTLPWPRIRSSIHGMLFYCPDAERSSSLATAARAAGARSLVSGGRHRQ